MHKNRSGSKTAMSNHERSRVHHRHDSPNRRRDRYRHKRGRSKHKHKHGSLCNHRRHSSPHLAHNRRSTLRLNRCS